MITLREEKPLPHAAGPLECSFLCLDKPAGPSSHEATVWARNILGVERGGHAGTLDPIVTGVLPIAIGSAVKLLRALAQSDKEYVCIAKFKRSPEGIEKALREFTGKIYQTPPEESAVKKALRTRAIHGIRLLEVDGTRALFKAKCQHGTYIRTLCKDLGEVMGNACEMEELRRISAGPFSEKDCCTFQELKDFGYEKCLLPPEKGLSNLK